VLTMNSVKILHAVRSAITAIAELLVYILVSQSVGALSPSHLLSSGMPSDYTHTYISLGCSICDKN